MPLPIVVEWPVVRHHHVWAKSDTIGRKTAVLRRREDYFRCRIGPFGLIGWNPSSEPVIFIPKWQNDCGNGCRRADTIDE